MNIFNTTVKVCGITREEDARMCLDNDVRWIGLNLYEESPRHVSLERAQELFKVIPIGQRVYVDVAPHVGKLHAAMEAGFDRFQIHFDHKQTPPAMVEGWADAVSPKKLWLAPRLPAHTSFPVNIFPLAWTFLIDGYSSGSYGGTGKTANWRHFRAFHETHQEKGWILAGGLNPTNIKEAQDASGANFFDLNSGIETAPGIKDKDLLLQALDALD